MRALRAYLRGVGGNMDGFHVLALIALKNRDDQLLARVLGMMIETARDLAYIASRGAHHNPPTMPETPGEWFLMADQLAKTWKYLARWTRIANGRVSSLFLKRMAAATRKAEQDAILQVRAMREHFLKKWPARWTRAVDSKYRKWYSRRLS